MKAETITRRAAIGRILIAGLFTMLVSAVDWKSKRETLRAKRDVLFKRYVKNPHDSSMALDMKNLDDEIAECTKHMDHLNKAKQITARFGGHR